MDLPKPYDAEFVKKNIEMNPDDPESFKDVSTQSKMLKYSAGQSITDWYCAGPRIRAVCAVSQTS